MQPKPKNVYRRITKTEIARFKAEQIIQGNNTAAIRKLEPFRLSPKDRAFRIAKKSAQQNATDFIDEKLQQIATDAVNRLGMLVNSTDEKIATKNVHYAIDHLRGKPLQRTESKHLSLNIQSVLD